MYHPIRIPADGRRKRRKRRGFLLLMVMVCLAVGGMLIVAIVRNAVLSYQSTRLASWGDQSQWLVESGAERAAARLRADSAYSGETWTIDAADLDDENGGVVQIQVKTEPQHEQRRLVSVTADFPNDPLHHARREKTFTIDLNSK